ncbi:MAG: hypothetical protein ABID38_04330 [Candidatus Diapherotrites archaeon]
MKLNLLLIPNKQYTKGILKLAKYMSDNYNKICYVSLNEFYDSLSTNLEKINADPSKFFIVDAITKTANTNILEKSNATFVSSPNALVELSLAITDCLETQNPDVLILDSISTLLIYEKESTVTKFVHSLIGKIKVAGSDCFLTALEGDSDNETISDLGMFVDNFLTMSEFELNLATGLEELPYLPENLTTAAQIKEELKEIPKPVAEIAAKEETHRIAIKGEMQKLRDKLDTITIKPQTKKHLDLLEKKLDRIEARPDELAKELGALKESIDSIKTQPKLGEELSLISSKIDELKEMEKRLNRLENKPGGEEINKALVDEFRNIGRKLDSLTLAEKRIDVLEKRPIDNSLREELIKLGKRFGEINRLEEKIDSIEVGKGVRKDILALSKKFSKMKKIEKRLQKFEEKKPGKEVRKELLNLSSRLKRIEKKPEISRNILLINKRLESLNRGMEKQRKLEKKLERKQAEASKRIIEKIRPSTMAILADQKAAREVERLERQLILLNKSYSLGVISSDAYEKDKAKLEARLRK